MNRDKTSVDRVVAEQEDGIVGGAFEWMNKSCIHTYVGLVHSAALRKKSLAKHHPAVCGNGPAGCCVHAHRIHISFWIEAFESKIERPTTGTFFLSNTSVCMLHGLRGTRNAHSYQGPIWTQLGPVGRTEILVSFSLFYSMLLYLFCTLISRCCQ